MMLFLVKGIHTVKNYIIDFPLNRSDKQAIIQSVWIVRNNEGLPRLVTCYVI